MHQVPKKLDAKQKEILEQFAEISGEQINIKKTGSFNGYWG